MYHEYRAKGAKDKLDELETYCEQMVSKCQVEINCILLITLDVFILVTKTLYLFW
jgi:hypothetical protein